VKQTLVFTALAAAVLALSFGSQAQAQQQPIGQPAMGAPGAGGVALLDVSYIFKNHARFKAMMSQMESDIEAAEQSVKKEKEAIKQLSDRMEEHRSGSPDYKALEEELARRSSDLQIRIQLQKKDFLQRQSKIHHAIYQEVLQEVEYYCASAGIAMVMRFNGDPIDVQKPDDVLRQINQQVVWFGKDRDITPIILERLNRAQLNPGNNANQPAARPGVPLQR